jgi:hypothetical protein
MQGHTQLMQDLGDRPPLKTMILFFLFLPHSVPGWFLRSLACCHSPKCQPWRLLPQVSGWIPRSCSCHVFVPFVLFLPVPAPLLACLPCLCLPWAPPPDSPCLHGLQGLRKPSPQGCIPVFRMHCSHLPVSGWHPSLMGLMELVTRF